MSAPSGLGPVRGDTGRSAHGYPTVRPTKASGIGGMWALWQRNQRAADQQATESVPTVRSRPASVRGVHGAPRAPCRAESFATSRRARASRAPTALNRLRHQLDRRGRGCAARPPRSAGTVSEPPSPSPARRPVGDRAVMAGQLAHLLAVAEQEHVQVRVIPAEVPWHTGLAGPFVLIRLPDGVEAAYVDSQLRGRARRLSSTGLWSRSAGSGPVRRCPRCTSACAA
ncbi:Scr1 family TA system antitoxin-like transcriptional regulator [Micromonospora sp. NPDC047670]|uniref:Scr1 family TA system antitoxin-like transcriptional regulator n=1 Tax=Micromonospora sp. NPDC047670 TaxID=3364252 RepID=UPI00371F7F5C